MNKNAIVPETKDKTIKRLYESRSLLFEHVIKFGCITKCHTKLFCRIDLQLKELEGGSECDKCDHWDICGGCPYISERGVSL